MSVGRPSWLRHPLLWWIIRAGGALAGLMLMLGLPGCGYDAIRRAQGAIRAGDVRAARAELDPLADRGFRGPHEVLGWLEWGATLHEAGAHSESSRAFLEAEAAFDRQDRRPRTSISEELVAAATNPLTVAYRGTANERVLAPTYRAINALLAGEADAARSAFNEAAIRQDQALAVRAARVEAAKSASGRRGSLDVGRSVDAAASTPEVARRMADLERFRPYRDFVNPFTELAHGVFRLAAADGAGDADRALALLRSVAGMAPENSHVARTLESAERAAAGQPEQGTTHVFFATGFGPWRDAVRIDLPLILVNDEVDYVGVAFPQLEFDDRFEPWLSVDAAGEMARTEVVADMDRLVAVEFREEFPTLLTRAVLGAAAKTAAAWGVNQGTEDDDTLNAIARIAAGLYLVSQNQADTRAWTSLPKQFQYARVQTPASGVIRVSAPGSRVAEVAVHPEAVTLVFVRSMRPGLPLRVKTVVFGAPAPVVFEGDGPETEPEASLP